MRRILTFLVMAFCAGAQPDVNVTYLTTQASIQDAVKTIAHQAGLGYNWQKSFDQTDPACRAWVRDVRISAVPFATAIRQLLDPAGLRYEIENGEVVLYRSPNFKPHEVIPPDLLSRKISYYTAQKSVQYIVIDLAQQVGLGYNWDKSYAATDPECRRFVHNVSFRSQPFDKAMATILDPVSLRFRIEDGLVVLYRR